MSRNLITPGGAPTLTTTRRPALGEVSNTVKRLQSSRQAQGLGNGTLKPLTQPQGGPAPNRPTQLFGIGPLSYNSNNKKEGYGKKAGTGTGRSTSKTTEIYADAEDDVETIREAGHSEEIEEIGLKQVGIEEMDEEDLPEVEYMAIPDRYLEDYYATCPSPEEVEMFKNLVRSPTHDEPEYLKIQDYCDCGGDIDLGYEELPDVDDDFWLNSTTTTPFDANMVLHAEERK